ncbi:MAG: hypothetical protein JWO31_3583 [Phycisphaerales bacterium]|nr:hypothetical protein [Phycisphaerales bacterium]
MFKNDIHPLPAAKLFAAAAVSLLGLAGGCATSEGPRQRPGPRMLPESRVDRAAPTLEFAKPLPGPESAEPPPPPFYDAPLVNQRPPEQRAFVDAYNAVRRPRLAVFVNRTLAGEAEPVDAVGEPPVDRYDREGRRSPPTPAVRPGTYDEAQAKRIDYATIETVLTQWLAADGQTTIASPSAVRERLTADEVRKLQEGRTRELGDLVKNLSADVLVYVQAQPTRQTEQGLEIRLNAEAINIQGGEQIARATVLMPPPLDTEKVNRFTRFVGRKLMSDMTMSWSGPGPDRDASPPAAGPGQPPPPASQPAPAPQPPIPPPSPAVRPPDAPPPPAATPTVPTPDQPNAAPGAPASPAAAPPDGVPREKPSMMDRPQTVPVGPGASVSKPADDYPPPPASSNRGG